MFSIDNELSFIILCPELKFGGIKTTVSTINHFFPKTPLLCIVPANCGKEDLKRAKDIGPTYKGGKTLSSMINEGVKKSKTSWNLIVVAGNAIRYHPVLRYSRFATSEKDVLYPVLGLNNWSWDQSSIHGLLLNKSVLKDAGAFPEEESLYESKLLWSEKLLEKGYKLKGLVLNKF